MMAASAPSKAAGNDVSEEEITACEILYSPESLAISFSMRRCSFIMALDLIHFDGTRSARFLYVIVLCAFLVTVLRGLLLIFSNETNDVLLNNPYFYLKISRMFC